MRILRLPAYFYPEQMASTHLQNDRMKGFAAAGHTLVVYTPTPTRGIDCKTAERYKSIPYEELYDGHVQIHRFPLMQEGKNPLIRALRYALSCVKQYRKALKAQNIDVIYASSTPPIQGLMCRGIQKKLSKKQGEHVPIVYNLQDIFPDSLVTTGLTRKDSLIWKIGRVIENKTYACADHIIVISESFKRNIMNKGVSADKITVIPNWIDTEKVSPIKKEDNTLFAEFGIDPRKFLVVYAGNFGAVQGAHVVIEAAKLLQENAGIQFVIFGGGAEYDAAKHAAENLPNVMMHALLPQERVPEVYSLGDVALITCKKGVGESGMPSKTWSIMACNTPIIAAFDTDSELAQILGKADAGFCVEPEDARLLADTIVEFASGKGNKFSGGRAFVTEYASKTPCVQKYIDVCEACCVTPKNQQGVTV